MFAWWFLAYITIGVSFAAAGIWFDVWSDRLRGNQHMLTVIALIWPVVMLIGIGLFVSYWIGALIQAIGEPKK